MELSLNLWNIQDWLKEKGIEHLYTLDDQLPCFEGIRISDGKEDSAVFACLKDEPDNRQYKSVLSYKNGRIYFSHLSAIEAMNLLNPMIAEYVNWQKKMMKANFSSTSLENLLNLASAYFPFPLEILRNGSSIASNTAWKKKVREEKFLASNLSAIQIQTLYNVLADSTDEAFNTVLIPELGHFFFTQFSMEGLPIWLVAFDSNHNAAPGDLQLLKVIGTFVEQNISLSSNTSTPQSPEDYINQLYNIKDCPPALSPSFFSQTNWGENDPYTVFCCQMKNRCASFCLNPVARLLKEQFPGACTLINGSSLFLFYNVAATEQIPTEADFKDTFLSELLYTGQSTIQNGFRSIVELAEQAVQAAETARHHCCCFINAQSISTQKVLEKFYAYEELQALVHPAIRQLKKLDDQSPNSFGYLKTLEAFLTNGANISAAARDLDLHRNTLVNRIERIKTLTGLSLSEPEEYEALLLSLLIYKDHTTESGKY